jgi:hypothetical protein
MPQPISLPDGVSIERWVEERRRWQNPRLRAFLGCVRALDEVLESNFAILHCSPRRLLEMWTRVREISVTLREDVAPLLEPLSCIPRLDAAVRDAELNLSMLELGLLRDLDQYPEHPSREEIDELRPKLCSAVGKLTTFLQDTFGHLLAADPRSHHDADYFMSRRFARDVDEAEWLEECVAQLDEYLRAIGEERHDSLTEVARHVATEQRLPEPDRWHATEILLRTVVGDLTPMVKRTMALRGVRIDELQTLDVYATEIPVVARLASELYHAADDMNYMPRDPLPPALCSRLSERLTELDGLIRDLISFVPLWRASIGQRRALMLRGSWTRGRV